jgi:hypothetical protein
VAQHTTRHASCCITSASQAHLLLLAQLLKRMLTAANQVARKAADFSCRESMLCSASAHDVNATVCSHIAYALVSLRYRRALLLRHLLCCQVGAHLLNLLQQGALASATLSVASIRRGTKVPHLRPSSSSSST